MLTIYLYIYIFQETRCSLPYVTCFDTCKYQKYLCVYEYTINIQISIQILFSVT